MKAEDGLYEDLVELIESPDDMHLLDVGCGPWFLPIMLARANPTSQRRRVRIADGARAPQPFLVLLLPPRTPLRQKGDTLSERGDGRGRRMGSVGGIPRCCDGEDQGRHASLFAL